MIFAELVYQEHYADAHDRLVALLLRHFSRVRYGLQCDSWIWILDGQERVAIDTFSAMKHQIKSQSAGDHVNQVIQLLRKHYFVRVCAPPQPE